MRTCTAIGGAIPWATSPVRFRCACPTLRALGLDRLVALGALGAPAPSADAAAAAWPSAIGRMAEASAGKDSVTGHWEMMGIVLDRPFPVFPRGFSPEIIREFSAKTGPRASSATRPPPAR